MQAVEEREGAEPHRVVLFSTNDYLGLASHPDVKHAIASTAQQFGSGTRASAIVAGHSSLHAALERQLAQLKGTEACLLFPSGAPALLRRRACSVPALCACSTPTLQALLCVLYTEACLPFPSGAAALPQRRACSVPAACACSTPTLQACSSPEACPRFPSGVRLFHAHSARRVVLCGPAKRRYRLEKHAAQSNGGLSPRRPRLIFLRPRSTGRLQHRFQPVLAKTHSAAPL